MACIHCALVQGYLLTLIVPALLGRHLAIGLGLASGGGVHRENARVGFYVVWGTWEAPDTSKRILILVQEIFFCQWKRVWFATYIIQFQALSGRFAVTLKVQLSFRRFKINNFCLSTDLGYGLLGPLTYTWHDPKFGISVPSYAVNFIVGFCRLSILGLSWLYRD